MSDPQVSVEVRQPQITVELGSPVVSIESPPNAITVTASGPPGPPGAAGSSMSFTQSTPQATWTIAHNMGFYPAVSIIDDLGNLVLAPITYLSINTVQIAFTRPFSGTAYLS